MKKANFAAKLVPFMKESVLLVISSLLWASSVSAQSSPLSSSRQTTIEAGVTVGTTGVGVQVASPVYSGFRARLSASFMPHFEQSMFFDIQVGDQTESKYDAQGNRVETKFDRLSSRLEQITGYHVDEQVEMIGKPTYYNVGLMVDFFPFAKRGWYVTAGLFYGNKVIAEAVNSLNDAPSLVGVNFYNNIYSKIQEGEPIYNKVYLPLEQEEKILSYGRMGIHVGDFTPSDHTESETVRQYLMEPDANCTVSAVITVNRWKPYLGIGYSGRLLKGNDRYRIGFDCGALFWGGTPAIITHDGTNLSKDVYNIRGRVGDYVSLAKSFKVMPVLNLNLSRMF